MTPDAVRSAAASLEAAGLRPFLEVSGGVTLETVSLFAAAGADAVSVGALTHSAPALDLGLDVDPIDEERR
jgi:nicotinate-nucleotide pyrophosphorylase (carboxylating)